MEDPHPTGGYPDPTVWVCALLLLPDKYFKLCTPRFRLCTTLKAPNPTQNPEMPKSGVAPSNQKKEMSVHELFAGAFRSKSSICESCLFPKGKHQNSQKWAKFMNFSFWPFLWFGLPGRLMTKNTAFTRTVSKSSRELSPSSL